MDFTVFTGSHAFLLTTYKYICMAITVFTGTPYSQHRDVDLIDLWPFTSLWGN